MKYYEVTISINGEKEDEYIQQTFEVEAHSFEEAIDNLERDLDVSLR